MLVRLKVLIILDRPFHFYAGTIEKEIRSKSSVQSHDRPILVEFSLIVFPTIKNARSVYLPHQEKDVYENIKRFYQEFKDKSATEVVGLKNHAVTESQIRYFRELQNFLRTLDYNFFNYFLNFNRYFDRTNKDLQKFLLEQINALSIFSNKRLICHPEIKIFFAKKLNSVHPLIFADNFDIVITKPTPEE